MLMAHTPALFGAVASRGNDANTVLLLHFDGVNSSTVIPDASPKVHGNAFIGGSSIFLSTGTSKFGGTALLNNAAGYITFPNSSDWEFGAGDFTVDWWEYRLGSGIAIARDFTTPISPFMLSYDPSRQIYMTSNGSAWDIANARSFGPVTNSVWAHLAITRQGNTFRSFKDGVQQDTWTSSLAIFANSNPLCIGGGQNGHSFNGYIDELRVSKGLARWTANFTPPIVPYAPDPPPITTGNDYYTRILMHFDGTNGATVYPDSARGASNVHGWGGGAIISTGGAKFGQALYCNGATAISIPDSSDLRIGSTDFTIDCWFNTTAGAGTRRFLWGHCDSSAAATAISSISEIDASNHLYVNVFTGSTPHSITATTVPVIGTWYHLACIRTGNILKLFINGVQEGGDLAITGSVSPGSGIYAIGALGAYPSGLNFNGYIDEYRLSVGLARWTANFTPPAAPYS